MNVHLFYLSVIGLNVKHLFHLLFWIMVCNLEII